MKKLLILLSLLLATNAWATVEDDVELTCQLGQALFQVHLEHGAPSKSWYKLPRESNKDLIELLKRGVEVGSGPSRMGGAEIFFKRYKKENVDSYFDVPIFKLAAANFGEGFIVFATKRFPRSGLWNNYRWLTLNRSTGELNSKRGHMGLSTKSDREKSTYVYYGYCESGLLSKLPVKPIIERKF